MPAVSVVIALFNKGPFVAETVRSVLSQTMTDWEMIVVDNGSTDDGPETVRRFADPRIRLISIEGRGPAVARNSGLRLATGEWVLFLDADDLIEPDFLSEQLAVADTRPGADVIVSRWQNFTDGDPLRRIPKWPTPRTDLLDTAICFTPWALHAALVRREAIGESVMWPEHLDGKLAEDTAFWFPLVNLLRIEYSDSQGALYRTHTAGCRTAIADPKKWFDGNHGAVTANLKFLSDTGREVTAGQCESLMRLYSQLYMNARQASGANRDSAQVARESLALATRWLKHRWSLAAPATWPLRLRQFLGISGYMHISQYASLLLRTGQR
jgi:hypothetical protein